MHVLHVIVYKILRFFVRPWLALKGGFSCPVTPQKSKANLILTNHNTNWDFLYFGASFKEHMYFVASEHIFRSGFKSKLLKWFLDPIPRKKGASAISTTKEIMRRLKKGYNICMMAEGNRSFSGETGFISPNTAALARKCGAGLITYRLHGAYFVNPRWSREVRKGPVWGEVAGQYTHEELMAMTVEEVTDIINRDLYVDAYEDQKGRDYSYTAKAPAEDLETALYSCPDCGGFACLESKGDRLVCKNCGSTHVYTPQGSLVKLAEDGSPAPDNDQDFRTILSWSNWQKKHLHDYINELPAGSLVRTDNDIKLYYVHPLEGKQLALEGSAALYKDRFEFNGKAPLEDGTFAEKTIRFDLKDIESLAVILINTMLFTAKNDYYELHLPQKGSALHYMISYYFLSGKDYKR